MVPSQVKLHQVSGILELIYVNSTVFKLSAEFLRVYSPSAEVQGHSPGQAVLQHGKKLIKITNLTPQGHYALRIAFSDDHDSGIYSWDYLYELGRQQTAKWAAYLQQLAQAGKSRDLQFIAVQG